MCIICKCGAEGEAFISAYESARNEMRKATFAMLKCSQTAENELDCRRYDATHKAMVRIAKDWNRLEEFRETGSTKIGGRTVTFMSCCEARPPRTRG